MQKGRLIVPGCLLGLALGAIPGAALAATTTTTTMSVSATVLASCTVAASALAFGAYTGTVLTATTTISVTCTSTTPYNVGLDAGGGTGATVANRLMVSGAATLAYGLYSNAGRTTVWGNTVGTNTVAGVGTGTAQSLTVYGQIAAGLTPAPGSYTDTVGVTVTY